MVEAYELSVLRLPEDLGYEVVLLGIPGGKVVQHKSAGIPGVGVEAPEGVVQMVFRDELSHVLHPGEVIPLHEAAPLTYQEGCDLLIVDIEPSVVPVVVHEGFVGKASLEPGLRIYRGTVVVGRIDHLSIPRFGTEVDGIVGNRSQVTAPPGIIVVGVVCGCEIVALGIRGIDLDTLDDDKSIGVGIQNYVSRRLRGIFPVVLILGVVPNGVVGL